MINYVASDKVFLLHAQTLRNRAEGFLSAIVDMFVLLTISDTAFAEDGGFL